MRIREKLFDDSSHRELLEKHLFSVVLYYRESIGLIENLREEFL